MIDLWMNIEGSDLTHYCAGKDDTNEMKPKGTQTDMTMWFNPTAVDKETGVITCVACGSTYEKEKQ